MPGLGELRISTKTANEQVAQRYDLLVCQLRSDGRLDALRALKSGDVSLQDLDSHREANRLADLLGRRASPLLRPLLDEWLCNGAADMGIRNSSMKRYATSWRTILQDLSAQARVEDIDQQFVNEFLRRRRRTSTQDRSPLSPATLNRDLAAVGAFLRWCEEQKACAVVRPRLKYSPESKGKTRWLTAAEIQSFREHCPNGWWPLFGLLIGTGIAVGEALGLRRADLDLNTGLVSIHEGYGRMLKRASRARELSVPDVLRETLADHLERNTKGQMDRVFPHTYSPARKAWGNVCRRAKIVGATIHDARHTFAVHAVMSGVPESRLQRLLGHSHPITTRRYAMFAPGQFVKEDAASASGSMNLGGLAPTRPSTDHSPILSLAIAS